MMEDKLKRRELRSTRSQQHRMMQELNHQQQSQQQKSNGNGAQHLKEENQQIVSDFVTEHSNTVNDKLEDKDSQQAQSQALFPAWYLFQSWFAVNSSNRQDSSQHR